MTQAELVASLQSQLDALQEEVATAKANLDILRASSGEASQAALASAEVEHAALLKAQADLTAIQGETEALQAAHSEAVAALEARIKDLEEKALALAIEVYQASGRKWRPWAANGRACRVGEIVLIVGSDTVVPEQRLPIWLLSSMSLVSFSLSVNRNVLTNPVRALRIHAGRALLLRERYRVLHQTD